MKTKTAMVLVIGACSLGACEGTGVGTREVVGTGGGAVAGAVIGRAITGNNTGMAIGAILGGLLGNRAGAWLDEEAQRKIEEANRQAASAPVGQQINWQSNDAASGRTTASGWVRPVSEPVQTADGRQCRELEQSATKEGETRTDRVQYCSASVPANSPTGGSGWVRPPRSS